MRDIRFRCWNVHSQTMHSWKEMVRLDKIHLLDNQKKNYPIMQYTGLKDKNGVEIYVGDIVKAEFYAPDETYLSFGAVEWCEESMQFKVRDNFGEFDPLCEWGESECEVVGNIYENADILKVKKQG